jgi:hypothetical protein
MTVRGLLHHRLASVTGSVTGSRRQWLLVFVGFFLVFGAWAFAAPYDGPADEVQHVVRAVGVVSGQVAPKPAVVKDGQGHDGMGAYQDVPKGLGTHASCWGFNPSRSAACAPPLSGGPVEPVATSAGRYNPLYYAMVGLPLKLSPNWTGLVLARLISAALSAALLACAFVVLARWSRFGLMLAGLLAATTPMLAHLAGAVNPNGLEIAAGIALFSAGIPLLLGPPRGRTTPLVWLFGVSTVLLATLRSLGPMWVFFALVALFVPQSRAAVRRMWNSRAMRWWAVAVAVAGIASLGWIVVMKTGGIIPIPGLKHYTLGGAVLKYFNGWGGTYLQGLVGVAGWFDVFMPAPFYWVWITAAASLVVFALMAGTWSERWRLLVIAFGGVVPPGVMQVSEANTVGFIIGGRYMLPLLAGLPLLAAFIVERRVVTRRQAYSLTKMFCVGLLPMHLVLLVYAMVRWQKGVSSTHLNPLAGAWHPPTGSLLPLVLMVAGLVVVLVMFWAAPRSAVVAEEGDRLDDTPAADAEPEAVAWTSSSELAPRRHVEVGDDFESAESLAAPR